MLRNLKYLNLRSQTKVSCVFGPTHSPLPQHFLSNASHKEMFARARGRESLEAESFE